MTERLLPNPHRLRYIPPHFSWIDHRLVRDDYFESCSCNAMALYLFLLTVADHRGLSYYSQPSLMKQLNLGTFNFTQARFELIHAKLIAYKHPLYQVLSLASPSELQPIKPSCSQQQKHTSQPVQIKQILKQLTTGEHHD